MRVLLIQFHQPELRGGRDGPAHRRGGRVQPGRQRGGGSGPSAAVPGQRHPHVAGPVNRGVRGERVINYRGLDEDLQGSGTAFLKFCGLCRWNRNHYCGSPSWDALG